VNITIVRLNILRYLYPNRWTLVPLVGPCAVSKATCLIFCRLYTFRL